MELIHKPYQAFSLDELYRIMQLRQEVFIVEQDCPYLDADDHDQNAIHVLGMFNNKILAYSRIVPEGEIYDNYVSIGRVITAMQIRGKRLGKLLFQFAFDSSKELFPESPIKLSSQVYIKDFYGQFGFELSGPTYMEDGIPHVAMVWYPDQLKPA